MKSTEKIWLVEAHNLGALQVRQAMDAIVINRKHWLAGEKADRLVVGIGGSIEEALEVERELKGLKGTGGLPNASNERRQEPPERNP